VLQWSGGERGASVLGRWSSDGRRCWLWLGLGMLTGGREGLFELGQQLQQQGESQAALHCFLSCLLGLTHVQSFNSLPNCLHQVSKKTEDSTPNTLITFVSLCPFLCLTPTNLCVHYMHSLIYCISFLHSCIDTFAPLLLSSIINYPTP